MPIYDPIEQDHYEQWFAIGQTSERGMATTNNDIMSL
jgi:hypothetical protein